MELGSGRRHIGQREQEGSNGKEGRVVPFFGATVESTKGVLVSQKRLSSLVFEGLDYHMEQ
jgi:hypothetical protein